MGDYWEWEAGLGDGDGGGGGGRRMDETLDLAHARLRRRGVGRDRVIMPVQHDMVVRWI